MAETLKRGRRAAVRPTTTDPIEIALDAAAKDATPPPTAERVLLAHERLLRWQIAGEKAALSLRILLGLAGVIAAALLVTLAINAWRDQSLVIVGFGVPEDLAREGTSGAALATELKDKLARMQQETVSVYATGSVREQSSSGVTVVIPETGISLTELDRMMRVWFGRETPVTGELMRIATGPERGALALNVRLGAKPGVRFVRPDGDLQPLLQHAAEHLYKSSQPLRYTQWLQQKGRGDEALALLRTLSNDGSNLDRAEAYSQLAAVLGNTVSLDERVSLQQQALRLNPNRGSAMINLAGTYDAMGRQEEHLRQSIAAGRVPAPEGSNAGGQALWGALSRSNIGRSLGEADWAAIYGCTLYDIAPCRTSDMVSAALLGPDSSRIAPGASSRLASIAGGLADGHDGANAERLLSQPRPAPAGSSPMQVANRAAGWISATAAVNRHKEDWVAVAANFEAWEAMTAPWPGTGRFQSAAVWGPYALLMLSRADEAQAAIDKTRPDCYPCLIMRGRMAAAQSDPAGAQRWFAEAKRRGPSLPQADEAWGRMLLSRGDAKAAIPHFAEAARRSPRFADAQEGWGEALLGSGDAKGAITKFEDAHKLTPTWGRLQLKWGEALMRSGKAAEARAKWVEAGRLGLTPTERAVLQALTQQRTP